MAQSNYFMRLKNIGLILNVIAFGTSAMCVYAEENNLAGIPEEYLTTGEQSTALSNGGSLSSAGYSAVRSNPAMLAVDRIYTLGGGYHWPAKGREFYEAGVVDGRTSSIAAGLIYTSSMDDYEGSWNSNGEIKLGDTPVKRRATVALAYTFKTIAFGINGGFVETANPDSTFNSDADRVRGYTAGLGAMAGITNSIRAGLSVENLLNKTVEYAAPTIYRAGVAWAVSKDINIYLDYRLRDAVFLYEGRAPDLGLINSAKKKNEGSDQEQALMVGGMTKIYDLLRLTAGASFSNSGVKDTIATSGGLALVNKAFNVSYSVQKPDSKLAELHHAASLGFDMAL
ncbi:MAG: hypothetical protein NT027_10370 [Proteobacteria bacterium]|nr:hypothetical protein [Pseudomonadota bacterium]